MIPPRIAQVVRLAIPLIVFHTIAFPRAAAQSGVDSAVGQSPAIAELLAKAGYIGIPFHWDGLYIFVNAKVDTASVDFTLDSGHSVEFSLDPSLAQVPGMHPSTVTSVRASAYGTYIIPNGTLDRVTLGPLTLGPLNGLLFPPIIGSAQGMLGAPMFADRAAIFDFDTDTLYLLAAGATSRPLKQPAASPSRNLRAALEAAGQYRTFLSLMQAAGLMPLLDKPAGSNAAADSLAWIEMEAPAVHHAGLDTMPDGAERIRLIREAMNRHFHLAGQITVFAPTDAAFARLAPKTLQALRADRAQLAAVLRAHLLTSASLQTGTLRALLRGVSQPAGPTLGFHPRGPQLDVDRLTSWENGTVLARATIIQPDLVAVNGVVHGIDRVLISTTGPSPLARELEHQRYVAIPIERLRSGYGWYIVRAKVNGMPLILMIDTGAPAELALDTQVLERLHLSEGGSVSVAMGTVSMPSISVPLDLSMINASLKFRGVPPVDGLLGIQTLAKHHARYDFGAGILYLRLPNTTAASDQVPSP